MAWVTRSRAVLWEAAWWAVVLTVVMTATVVMSDEQLPGSGYVEVPCCTHHFRHQKGLEEPLPSTSAAEDSDTVMLVVGEEEVTVPIISYSGMSTSTHLPAAAAGIPSPEASLPLYKTPSATSSQAASTLPSRAQSVASSHASSASSSWAPSPTSSQVSSVTSSREPSPQPQPPPHPTSRARKPTTPSAVTASEASRSGGVLHARPCCRHPCVCVPGSRDVSWSGVQHTWLPHRVSNGIKAWTSMNCKHRGTPPGTPALCRLPSVGQPASRPPRHSGASGSQ